MWWATCVCALSACGAVDRVDTGEPNDPLPSCGLPAEVPHDPDASWLPGGEGPWRDRVVLACADEDGALHELGVFAHNADVPTILSTSDGRTAVAFQHYSTTDPSAFDVMQVQVSHDHGAHWEPPVRLEVEALPAAFDRPVDPTLVELADGRFRLYFSWRGPEATVHIASATASQLTGPYTYDPGPRVMLPGAEVRDASVALHDGRWHLYSPGGYDPASPAPAVHAVSTDGLSFTLLDPVQLDALMLGSVQSEADHLRFFASGRQGVVSATSADGVDWKLEPPVLLPMRFDPGVVTRPDGTRMMVATALHTDL